MNEKQKMLAGLPYDAWDETLLNERMRAKALCHQFNQADPTKLQERMALLKPLVKFAGKAHIESNFFCDYGYNIRFGHEFYANHNFTILDVCEVTFGDYVFVGPNVMIATASHPVDPEERKTTEFGRPIKIGNNVWIGGNCAVLPGVTIGDNCVIGAGSVVTKDIPANSVAVGNPARVQRTI